MQTLEYNKSSSLKSELISSFSSVHFQMDKMRFLFRYFLCMHGSVSCVLTADEVHSFNHRLHKLSTDGANMAQI